VTLPFIEWQFEGPHRALWYSEAGLPPPMTIKIVDDTLSAKQAIRDAKAGIGLLWNGDYHNAREILKAMSRRLVKKPRIGSQTLASTPAEMFHQHRLDQKRKAEILGLLLIPMSKDFEIILRRGQDVSLACREVLGDVTEDVVMPLKTLLAINSAHEWRKKKIQIPHFDQPFTPHFGVFSPVRGEYIDLVMQTQLPPNVKRAFDIGVGSGILAILLAKKGVNQVIGTDSDARAIACATENIQAFGLGETIQLQHKHLFPEGVADLIICNPPWIPAMPSAPIEYAIFDPDSAMIKALIQELPQHLSPTGQAWIIISDIAEHLGLRSRDELLQLFESAQLKIVEKKDIYPKHPKTRDNTDPLAFARTKEITSLWILSKKSH
jgi:SAM-dependent methyltransferase